MSPLRQWQIGLANLLSEYCPKGMGMEVPKAGVGHKISRRDATRQEGEEEIAYDPVGPTAPAAGARAGENGECEEEIAYDQVRPAAPAAGEEESAYDRVGPAAPAAGARAGETGDGMPQQYSA